MANTFSSTLGWMNQGTGDNNNTWGDNCDISIFPIFERAIAGGISRAVVGGTLDLSGTPPPAGATQPLDMIQEFTGVLAANEIVQVPNLTKLWLVNNKTTGAFTLTFKTPAGSASSAIPQGGWTVVWCDGSNVIYTGYSTGQLQTPDGTLAVPGLSTASDPDTGWRRTASGTWRYDANGVDILELSPSGLNLLVGTLQIAGAQVIPPGTEEQYAGIELPDGGWLWEDGTAVSRASNAALFAALTKATTGDTHTSTTIDNIPIDLRKRGLLGAIVEGTGIQTGTTVTAVAISSVTISPAATATAAGVAIRFLPWGQGDAATTFNVPDRRERILFGRGDVNGSTVPGRITTAGSAIDSTKLNVSGGTESVTLTQANLPNVNFSNSLSLASLAISNGSNVLVGASQQTRHEGPGSGFSPWEGGGNQNLSVNSGTITGTVSSGGSATPVFNMPPVAATNYIIKT